VLALHFFGVGENTVSQVVLMNNLVRESDFKMFAIVANNWKMSEDEISVLEMSTAVSNTLNSIGLANSRAYRLRDPLSTDFLSYYLLPENRESIFSYEAWVCSSLFNPKAFG
jgi:hypothetical protein